MNDLSKEDLLDIAIALRELLDLNGLSYAQMAILRSLEDAGF